VNIIAAPVEKQQRPQHHGRRPWCHVTPLVTPPELSKRNGCGQRSATIILFLNTARPGLEIPAFKKPAKIMTI
jgi:hypothetical protein